MLSSTAEREVLNAVRSRCCGCWPAPGSTFTPLPTGRSIEARSEPAPLSAAEMQRIYDNGFENGFADGSEHGRRSAVIAAPPIGTFDIGVNSGVNGYTWQQIAQHCARQQASVSRQGLRFRREHRRAA